MWGTYGAPDMTHTHVIHRHLQAHKTTFNLQSEIGVHTYWHARAPAEKTGVMDSGCLCVRVGISLILFFLPFWGRCVRVIVCVSVCVREIISGRWREPWPLLQGQRGEVNQHRLLPPLLSILPPSSLLPSSLQISLNAHPRLFITPFFLSIYLFLYFFMSCLRKTKAEEEIEEIDEKVRGEEGNINNLI